jgi:putative ABC transport system permease protein
VARNEIAVNDDFIAATRVDVGDTIQVSTGYDPQLRTYTDSRAMVVTGRVRFLYGAANQLATAMNLPVLQEMTGLRDDASLFMIKVRDGVDVEQTRAWIEKEIPEVSALSIATALEQVDQRLSYFRQLAFILGTVSLFVGFLLVTTLMTVSVNERIGEITVMRALGVSKSHIVQQIVLEGIVITLGGALAGLALGLVTARYLNGILSSFPGLPVAIDFFLFQPKAAWMSLGMLSLSGIAAGVYPSLRAASLPIATTLREEAVA